MGGPQRPILRVNEAKKTGARKRGQNPLVCNIEKMVFSIAGSRKPTEDCYRGFVRMIRLQVFFSEPVFENLLRSLGIDFQPGRPVWQPYLSYRPARLHRLAESIPRNRFPGSRNVYKYGLWYSITLHVVALHQINYLYHKPPMIKE
jgi:hypothetical protein